MSVIGIGGRFSGWPTHHGSLLSGSQKEDERMDIP